MLHINGKERLRRRHKRIRVSVTGTEERPRLSVFRSNKHLQAQIIDDTKGVTLLSVSDLSVKKKNTKQGRATLIGQELAKKALEKGITKVVFDRGGFRYQGRVRAFADAARKGGLAF